jgi:hypothetical protein
MTAGDAKEEFLQVADGYAERLLVTQRERLDHCVEEWSYSRHQVVLNVLVLDCCGRLKAEPPGMSQAVTPKLERAESSGPEYARSWNCGRQNNWACKRSPKTFTGPRWVL